MLWTTFWLKAPPTVLTPMIVVGLILSMAATKSRVGTCSWAYGIWKSTRSLRVRLEQAVDVKHVHP